MAKVLDEILDAFYAKLSESGAVNEATVNELRTLLASEKKMKAVDFVGIFKKAAQAGTHDPD